MLSVRNPLLLTTVPFENNQLGTIPSCGGLFNKQATVNSCSESVVIMTFVALSARLGGAKKF